MHFSSVSYLAPFLFFSVHKFRSEQNPLRQSRIKALISLYFVCYFLLLAGNAPYLH